jgi:hypothetical protein
MDEAAPDNIVDSEEALLHMPLISTAKLTQMRRDGNGPKFAVIGNRVRYRVSDLETWYAKFKKEAFTQTVTQRRGGRKPGTATKTGKGGRKATASDMLA